jgi:hypothetical protein
MPCYRRAHVQHLASLSCLAVLAVLGTGCERSPTPGTVRYRVRLEADARTHTNCREVVGVRFIPVQTAQRSAGAASRNDAFSERTEIRGTPVLDSVDNNWECWFTYDSPPLALGKWQVVGEFADSSRSCLRDVVPDQPNAVRIDQDSGCSDWDGSTTQAPSQPPAPAHPEQETPP